MRIEGAASSLRLHGMILPCSDEQRSTSRYKFASIGLILKTVTSFAYFALLQHFPQRNCSERVAALAALAGERDLPALIYQHIC